MTYDAANRLTKEDYSNPDAAVIDYANTFGYDDTNNITQLTDPSGTISSAFSGRDNKLWENNRDNKRVTYTYDCVENRDTMRDSDGGRFTYTYDVKNRLRTTKNPKNEVTTCSYDLADRETRRDLANGTFMVRDYDQDGRIEVLTNEKVAGALISKFTYTYDCADNRQNAEALCANISETTTSPFIRVEGTEVDDDGSCAARGRTLRRSERSRGAGKAGATAV